jgi:hypothetical protein
MCDAHRRQFLGLSVLTLGAAALAGSVRAAEPQAAPTDKPKVYTCPPCGCPNDGKEFAAPGPCSACGMPLVEKPATSTDKPKSEQPAPKAEPPR